MAAPVATTPPPTLQATVDSTTAEVYGPASQYQQLDLSQYPSSPSVQQFTANKIQELVQNSSFQQWLHINVDPHNVSAWDWVFQGGSSVRANVQIYRDCVIIQRMNAHNQLKQITLTFDQTVQNISQLCNQALDEIQDMLARLNTATQTAYHHSSSQLQQVNRQGLHGASREPVQLVHNADNGFPNRAQVSVGESSSRQIQESEGTVQMVTLPAAHVMHAAIPQQVDQTQGPIRMVTASLLSRTDAINRVTASAPSVVDTTRPIRAVRAQLSQRQNDTGSDETSRRELESRQERQRHCGENALRGNNREDQDNTQRKDDAELQRVLESPSVLGGVDQEEDDEPNVMRDVDSVVKALIRFPIDVVRYGPGFIKHVFQ